MSEVRKTLCVGIRRKKARRPISRATSRKRPGRYTLNNGHPGTAECAIQNERELFHPQPIRHAAASVVLEQWKGTLE